VGNQKLRGERGPRVPAEFAPLIRTPLPGPRARRVLARDRRFITPSYTRTYPLVIDRGEGAFVTDPDGNRFLDFTTGVAVNALGHAHPEIVRVVIEQAGRFLHMAGTDFYYDVMADYAAKLCSIMPGRGRWKCFLANSGTEAIEAALKLARHVTRRPRFVAFFGAFHGRSMGALSLTASKALHRRHFAPLLPDVSHAPYGDLDFVERFLFRRTTPPEDVAAVFVEAIQGEGGYNVAPPGFLRDLRALCDRHGILLVADEIQSGIGRTGRMWAVEHWGVVPDVVCTAKAVGGGLPIGAMVARAGLHRWPSGAHANTFGGNPLACAAGLRTIELVEGGLMENARRMGAHLSTRLRALASPRTRVGPPRGMGLMQALDVLGKSGAPDPERRNRAVLEAFRRGLLLLGCGDAAIRFLPSLDIRRGHIDAAADILRSVLARV
jgi:4-aminobutyrate aminotransferase